MNHTSKKQHSLLNISKQFFGILQSGESADLYTLINNNQLTISITNYGGTITAITMADRDGKINDIVLGYDKLIDYEADTYYLGAIIGRYAGRIKEGKLEINGEVFNVKLNSENSQLHGGLNGLNKQVWNATSQRSSSEVSLTLTHQSPDGYNGFPGNVKFSVKYTLDNENKFTVEYFAETDKPTIVNLTQHSYFNLAGHDAGSVFDHQVTLNADYFLPMNEQAYPTGKTSAVNGTPHDFTKLTTLNKNINKQDQQIQIGRGYDNYWLLNNIDMQTNDLACSAQIFEANSGRRLRLYTDQPSVILYTGNYLDGSHVGKGNTRYQSQHGLCIEPQRAFDHSITSENYQPFLTCILEPTKPFYSKSVYVFDTM